MASITEQVRDTTYEDLDFRVTFNQYPAYRGARERGSGVQLEPDEPASIEVTNIQLLHDGDTQIEIYDVLSEKVIEQIQLTVEENLSEEFEDDRY